MARVKNNGKQRTIYKSKFNFANFKAEYIKVKNSINSNNSFELKKVTKTKNIRNNEGNNNQIVLKTPNKPKFIQDRWEIVLKFRKEFQNK